MNSYDIIPVKNISSDLQQQWKDLSQRALQKNLYLCPEFVIPSLQLGDADPSLLAVWEPGTNRDRLAGLLIFEEHQPTANYPFRHAQLYQCVHAYLSGILLARESAVPVAAAMAAALSSGDLGVKALVFSDLSLRHSLADFFTALLKHSSISWQEQYRVSRAVLDYQHGGRTRWQENLSKNRRKDIARKRRRLAAFGEVSWRYVDGDQLVDPVETFLHLEHLGWKGANRTSLRSSPLDEAFFRQLVALSGPGAFFTELLVDGSVIASTSNFRIGDNGFAFKSGYHPEFSDASPGLLNEIFLLEHLEQTADLAYLDSGAGEGSYMDTLWPDRDILYSGIVTASAFTRQVTGLMSGVRSIKRRFYPSRLMASSG